MLSAALQGRSKDADGSHAHENEEQEDDDGNIHHTLSDKL